MATEKNLQEYIKKMLQVNGFLVYKVSGTAHRGIPDLMCISHRGDVFFIEVKSPRKTGRLSPLQKLLIHQWRARGVVVYVIDDKESVKGVIERFANGKTE